MTTYKQNELRFTYSLKKLYKRPYIKWYMFYQKIYINVPKDMFPYVLRKTTQKMVYHYNSNVLSMLFPPSSL